MAIEKVTILTEVVDKATGQLRAISERVREFNTRTKTQTETLRGLNQQTNQYDLIQRKTTRGLSRFNFGWLSVMFTGMALWRVFGGLIKSQFELFGINEMFSSLLTLVLLPVMELLLPLFIRFFDVVSSLPDSVKLGIGAFMILAAGLGLILLVVGQVALAVMGFGAIWPTVSSVALPVIKAVGGALGGIAAIAGIIVAVIIGMYLAWRDNFMKMRDIVSLFVSAIKLSLGGIIMVVSGILDIIVGLFSGDFEMMKEGIKKIFIGLWNFLKGGFISLAAFVGGVLVGALKIVHSIVMLIVDGIKYIGNKIGNLVGGIGKFVGNAVGLPSYQTGGTIPATGPYLLHKGEEVIPANKVGNNGGVTVNYTINASGSNTREFDRLIRENNTKLVSDLRRLINV